MPKTLTDYSKVIIYKLVCNDISVDDLYVGHTTNFTQRKNHHRICCNNENRRGYNRKVYEFIRNNGGWDNWSMIHIEEYNCNNKREAETKERFWIEVLKSNLNCNNPITTKEEILEKLKENYQENKEKKIEYQKKYSQENKEKISEQKKEYNEKNKEKISEQKKEYREKHKEEAVKAHKEWRETNKEKIKEERSQIINCECGNQYTFGNKHRHLESKIHINYQNQLCGIIQEPESVESVEEKAKIEKQKQKEYREENSDKIKEYKKKYNENNKIKNSEKAKEYYQENKYNIIEQQKNYIEENKDIIKKNKHDWYEKNKDTILSKQKELFTCECGSEVRCAGKSEHNKSVKHIKYIENLNLSICQEK
jgi:hypothetical protein